MTDTSANGSPGSTFRLIYRSHNRIPKPNRKELGAIFSVSRSSNKKRGVTGALLVHDDWFVQTLEGDEATVRGLYDHIYKDDRHETVSVIFAEPVEERVSPGGPWPGCPRRASPTSPCS